MGEVFNTEQFIQNLWERENLQGLKQVNGKGGYRNGRYFPYQGTNGIDIGPGFLLKSQSPAFQKKARTVGITKKELDDSIRSDESKTTQCTWPHMPFSPILMSLGSCAMTNWLPSFKLKMLFWGKVRMYLDCMQDGWFWMVKFLGYRQDGWIRLCRIQYIQ